MLSTLGLRCKSSENFFRCNYSENVLPVIYYFQKMKVYITGYKADLSAWLGPFGGNIFLSRDSPLKVFTEHENCFLLKALMKFLLPSPLKQNLIMKFST